MLEYSVLLYLTEGYFIGISDKFKVGRTDKSYCLSYSKAKSVFRDLVSAF